MTPGKIKQVFCIGLGGIGVSAVARMLLARGFEVSGSDPHRNPLVEDLIKLGVHYHTQENPELITADCDLVIYTDDAGPTHPMRVRAEQLGLPTENFATTLGRLMGEYPTRLTVAGTNGKSKTTALIGLLLTNAGLDPTVFVGSRVAEFSGNIRLGRGDMFVAEADEYRDHYLNYHPTIGVITNIEPDHLDYFKTSARLLASFNIYVGLLPPDGQLVVNGDDPGIKKLAPRQNKTITFGFESPADLQAINIIPAAGAQSWEALWQGRSIGHYQISLPGRFNIMNCLAAMAGALAVGAEPSTFANTLKQFHGIWRRFQILNPGAPVTVINDYAHHPTAVKVTLAGARKFYPGRRIVAVFQPHHRSRLTALFDDFVTAFKSADLAIMVKVYSVPGREVAEATTKTTRQLVDMVNRTQLAIYADSIDQAELLLHDNIRAGDVVIIMGAGDIWQMAERLAKQYA